MGYWFVAMHNLPADAGHLQMMAAIDSVGALLDHIAMHVPADCENVIAALKLSVANAQFSPEQASNRPARSPACTRGLTGKPLTRSRAGAAYG